MKNIFESKILALKYRPKTFKDLIGQELIAETISNAIKIKKIPNAYLLTGIRGVGKTTTARLIAKALNCTKKTEKESMCNGKDLCEHCKEIDNSNHIDVLEMDAASKTGIDDIRELIENAKYNPTSAKYKIFIIDEVHMLSKQAFNGLLKTLEEPPEKLKFIMATTESRKIPVTILSRCQRFDLKRVSLEKIFQHIKKIAEIENGKISDAALKLLSKASEGSVRDAISLLDRALVFQSLDSVKTVEDNDIRKMLGLADRSKLINLANYVFAGNEKEALELLKELIDNGLDHKNFLNDFLELLYLFSRRISLGSIEKDTFISEGEIQLIEKGSEDLDIQDINLFWQLTLKTIEDLKIVSSENIALEMFLIQLMHLRQLEENTAEKIFTHSKQLESDLLKKNIEENNSDPKKSNFTKNQMKSTQQIKTLANKELDLEKKFQVRSFSDLINLSEKSREIELKYDLERNVKLVNFEDGKIDINFNENLNKNFIKKLSQKLYDWTGKRWIISLSKDQSTKTFYQEKIDKKEELIIEGKKSKIFDEMKKTFLDADLTDVRREDE